MAGKGIYLLFLAPLLSDAYLCHLPRWAMHLALFARTMLQSLLPDVYTFPLGVPKRL